MSNNYVELVNDFHIHISENGGITATRVFEYLRCGNSPAGGISGTSLPKIGDKLEFPSELSTRDFDLADDEYAACTVRSKDFTLDDHKDNLKVTINYEATPTSSDVITVGGSSWEDEQPRNVQISGGVEGYSIPGVSARMLLGSKTILQWIEAQAGTTWQAIKSAVKSGTATSAQENWYNIGVEPLYITKNIITGNITIPKRVSNFDTTTNAVAKCFGHVNSTPMLNFVPGCVLYMGATFEEYYNQKSNKRWRVIHNFSTRVIPESETGVSGEVGGWNHILNPANQRWMQVTVLDASTAADPWSIEEAIETNGRPLYPSCDLANELDLGSSESP